MTPVAKIYIVEDRCLSCFVRIIGRHTALLIGSLGSVHAVLHPEVMEEHKVLAVKLCPAPEPYDAKLMASVKSLCRKGKWNDHLNEWPNNQGKKKRRYYARNGTNR